MYIKNWELKEQIAEVLRLQLVVWDNIKCTISEFKKLKEDDDRRLKAGLYVRTNKPSKCLDNTLFIGAKPTNKELKSYLNDYTANLAKLAKCEEYLLELF